MSSAGAAHFFRSWLVAVDRWLVAGRGRIRGIFVFGDAIYCVWGRSGRGKRGRRGRRLPYAGGPPTPIIRARRGSRRERGHKPLGCVGGISLLAV
jgi:hypothetical protein